MSIIKVSAKKAKSGFTYKVTFKYKEYGMTKSYSKSGFLTKKEAKEHETLVKAQIKKDGYLYKECTKTLNEVWNEFLEVGSSQYRYNTLTTYKSAFNKHIKNSIGLEPIVKINYAVIQNFFNNLNNSKQTNENIKSALNCSFQYAMKSGYIQSNLISLITVKGDNRKRENENILEYDQFQELLSFLRKNKKFSVHALAIAIEIGYYTGLRISEIFALEKSDIDFENNIINVNKNLISNGLKKKNFYAVKILKTQKSEAELPLAEPLKISLLEWFKENPYQKIVCDIEGGYLSPNHSQTRIKNIAKKINIDFHFHMLRHTFVTNLIINDVNVKTAQDLARHSNINTTMSVYTHIQNEEKKRAINAIFNTNNSKNTPKTNVN